MKKPLVILLLISSFIYAKQRLVVLDPASIEIIYLLGGGDEIVGIASLQHSNIYPEDKTKKLNSVGTFSNPSLEKIFSLKPSLVILSQYSLNLQDSLEKLGIKTMFLEANELSDMKTNIKKIGEILNKTKEADDLIVKFEKDMQEFKKDSFNKSAIFLFSSSPLMAFTDNSLIADILRGLGIKNLSMKSEIQRPIISSEFILKQNPDLIIIGIGARDIKELITQNEVLKNTNAYKNGQILLYDNTHVLLRLSPIMIERIKEFRNFLSENLNK
ncbi:ABC transporter substrate-binding protein [uncultured Campylobacter sp.]|uniref:ABC transporter substrate-binding protein n=1 Tax=uncultured Campylobacter sp. TaxID=218934 RepID=UPI00260E0E83|nr:ABC transporter substrate-binding protein [uncultured Campylobacter sp.]